MKFDKTRVYTAVNADELNVGDLVLAARTMDEIKNDVLRAFPIAEILDERESNRFRIRDMVHPFQLAYLVCCYRNREAYEAWNDGNRVEIFINDEWHDFDVNDEPDWVCQTLRPKEEQDPYKKLKEAYMAGKTIQIMSCFVNGKPFWTDCDKPEFKNIPAKNYRVKPELTYRPFKNADELIVTWRKMMGYPAKANTMPLIWVKSKINDNVIYCITAFTSTKEVFIGTKIVSLDVLMEQYTFLDGSPFGVKKIGR